MLYRHSNERRVDESYCSVLAVLSLCVCNVRVCVYVCVPACKYEWVACLVQWCVYPDTDLCFSQIRPNADSVHPCHFQAAPIISADRPHIGQIYNNSISISILMADIAWLIHACMSVVFYALWFSLFPAMRNML